MKWQNYPLCDSTWEPLVNIPHHRELWNAAPDVGRLNAASEHFERATLKHLTYTSTSGTISISMDLDICRYFFSGSGDLLEKEDFKKMNLSKSWYYALDRHGQGTMLKFPVRVSYSCRQSRKSFYVDAKGQLVPRKSPIETLKLQCSVKAADRHSI